MKESRKKPAAESAEGLDKSSEGLADAARALEELLSQEGRAPADIVDKYLEWIATVKQLCPDTSECEIYNLLDKDFVGKGLEIFDRKTHKIILTVSDPATQLAIVELLLNHKNPFEQSECQKFLESSPLAEGD